MTNNENNMRHENVDDSAYCLSSCSWEKQPSSASCMACLWQRKQWFICGISALLSSSFSTCSFLKTWFLLLLFLFFVVTLFSLCFITTKIGKKAPLGHHLQFSLLFFCFCFIFFKHSSISFMTMMSHYAAQAGILEFTIPQFPSYMTIWEICNTMLGAGFIFLFFGVCEFSRALFSVFLWSSLFLF